MKIIDKVLEEKLDLTYRYDSGKCTGNCEKCRNQETCWNWNQEIKPTPMVLHPTTRNLDEGLKNDNLPAMAKKLCEEATEVMEATTTYEILPNKQRELAQELLDTIQMAFNMVNHLRLMEKIVVDREVKAHNKKLIERGWELDTSLKIGFEEVQHESRG